MLVYSNHRGATEACNVYHDPNEQPPWRLEIGMRMFPYVTGEELLNGLRMRSMLTNEIENAVRKKVEQ